MLQESKSILIIMVLTILSKMLGFVREIVLASTFGTTGYTDAYLIATAIPLILFVGVAGALKTTFIPLYTNILQKRDKKEAIKFTNNILNVVILLAILLSLLGLLFVKRLVGLFAVGFEGDTLRLSIKFTRILMPAIVFIGINHILTGYLEANRKFNIPVLMGLPHNVIIITAIYLSGMWNQNILVYGTLLALFSQTLFLSYYSYKTGYRYNSEMQLKDENLMKTLYLVMPVFLGAAIRQINGLIDKTLASTLQEGSIAALNFADRLNSFVYGVFIGAIATVLYPMLSGLAAKGEGAAFKENIAKSISLMLLLIMPISAGAMCLSLPIVKVLFQRGSFDIDASQRTAVALFYYSLGMIGFGFRDILSKVFYSLQDTKTPMTNGVIAVAINIILNFILIRYMGHGGLALATSISALTGSILLLYSLRNKIGPFGGKKILIVVIKSCIASLVMATGVANFHRYISSNLGSGSMNETISVFLSILVGVLIYISVIAILKVEEINYFISRFREKGVFQPQLENSISKERLLLGVMSSEIGVSQKTAYYIAASIPEEKYDITLITASNGELIDWINILNSNRVSKINVITIPLLETKFSLWNDLKTLFRLYNIMRSKGYDIVHFHHLKLGILGEVAAWLARVPKIFLTIHEWEANRQQFTRNQKLLEPIGKLLTKRICTNVICTSNYDMNKGINNKWFHKKRTCVIHHGIVAYPYTNRRLRKELSIAGHIPILGTITTLDEVHEPIFIIELFYELKRRGHNIKLIIIGNGPLKEKCSALINELGLNLDIYLLSNSSDETEFLHGFDLFMFFSKSEDLPLVILDAMMAQKPVIANEIGGISELVKMGRSGFLLEGFNIDQGVHYTEKLLSNIWLKHIMGCVGKKIASNDFTIGKMIKEYEDLYCKP